MLNLNRSNIYTTLCPYSNISEPSEFIEEDDWEGDEEDLEDEEEPDACSARLESLPRPHHHFYCNTQECKHSGRLGDREERRKKE